MEFEIKNYKLLKIKQLLKKTDIIFFFNGNNLNLKNWVLIEQNLKKTGLTYYKIHNKLTIKAINYSIYENLNCLIQGLSIIIKPNLKNSLKFKTLINISPLLTLLGIVLNNKFYSIPQLKTLTSLSLNKNANILYRRLKMFLKIPLLYKLKIRNNVI